jgi:hypothetical protein
MASELTRVLTTTLGVGLPLDTSWRGVNSTTVGEAALATQRLRLLSKARPAGEASEPALALRTTGGVGAPLLG